MDQLIESSNYIIEAAKTIEKITDSFLFEEGEENESLASKAGSALKSAYDSMIAGLKKLIEKIKSILSNIFMSKEMKSRLDSFEEHIKNHPEIAEKKVEVTDFEKIDNAYNTAIQEANVMKNKDADKAEGNKILSKLNGIVKSATIIITVSTVFRLLLKNKKIAEGTATAMDKFSDVLESTKKTIDSKSRELRGKSNRSFWDRLTFGLMSKKKKNSEDGFKALLRLIKTAIPGTDENKDPNMQFNAMSDAGKVIKSYPNAVGNTLTGASKVLKKVKDYKEKKQKEKEAKENENKEKEDNED